MKLIIDIPEETYNAIIDDEWIDSEYINNVINSIQNGTLLPKGHERLFDERNIINGNYEVIRNRIYELETVIEADKGE